MPAQVAASDFWRLASEDTIANLISYRIISIVEMLHVIIPDRKVETSCTKSRNNGAYPQSNQLPLRAENAGDLQNLSLSSPVRTRSSFESSLK